MQQQMQHLRKEADEAKEALIVQAQQKRMQQVLEKSGLTGQSQIRDSGPAAAVEEEEEEEQEQSDVQAVGRQ